jgi:hypothetical protein
MCKKHAGRLNFDLYYHTGRDTCDVTESTGLACFFFNIIQLERNF